MLILESLCDVLYECMLNSTEKLQINQFLSYLILAYLILSYLILSYLILSYLILYLILSYYSHSSVTEPPFSHRPTHLPYMLHGSRFLKQVHAMQRRLVDLQDQRKNG